MTFQNHRLPEQILESLWAEAREIRRHAEFLEYLGLTEHKYQAQLPEAGEKPPPRIEPLLSDILPFREIFKAIEEEMQRAFWGRNPFRREYQCEPWPYDKIVEAENQRYARHIIGLRNPRETN